MHPLHAIIHKPEKLIIGLMSGTSIDGIDAALVYVKGNGFQTKWELIAFDIFGYPPSLRQELIEFASTEFWKADQFCRLNVVVGEYFALAAKQLCEKAAVPLEQVDLIGSHGQTIRHLPQASDLHNFSVRATLQIGEPAVIAKRCGIITVADFRPADVAVGGNGAPLVPYVDFLCFHSDHLNRGILNIGGIANLTLLPRAGTLSQVIAFDTGPGNMLIDGITRHFFQKDYDQNGELARRGTVVAPLLLRWLEQPYFQKAPPKTTGREAFGEPFESQVLTDAAKMQIKPADLLATLTAFTAFSIFQAYQKFILPQTRLDELIVSGGGSRNKFLMQCLENYFQPVKIRKSDDLGVPVDAKEALSFAILANETVNGRVNNVPGATGASQATILGKICL